MRTTPISANFEWLVVELIENGYLATISTEYDERTAFLKSLQRALKFLGTANDSDDEHLTG